MTKPEARRIPTPTPGAVWPFPARHEPLWASLEFFPTDAVGPRGPAGAPRRYEVKPIPVETDLDFGLDTDIQFGAWVFRPRSPKQPGMMRWCRERGLEVGDTIVFEKTGE